MSKNTTTKSIPPHYKVHMQYELGHQNGSSGTHEKQQIKVTASWPKPAVSSTSEYTGGDSPTSDRETIEFIVRPGNTVHDKNLKASCGTLALHTKPNNCVTHSGLQYHRCFSLSVQHQKDDDNGGDPEKWQDLPPSPVPASLTADTLTDKSDTCPGSGTEYYQGQMYEFGKFDSDRGKGSTFTVKITVLAGIQACHCDGPLQGPHN